MSFHITFYKQVKEMLLSEPLVSLIIMYPGQVSNKFDTLPGSLVLALSAGGAGFILQSSLEIVIERTFCNM